jgi:catechol 2,3-dioxygenase-like lactoylglutathione lyase family enzyme
MPLTRFEHVNLRTARLAEMVAWYEEILGLPTGPRPDFPFPGAWIYLGDLPVVHLVEVAQDPAATDPKIEHFAFGAADMAAFAARLDAKGVAYSVDPVPGFPIVQINLHDPDGNHIHVDFSAEDAAAAGLAGGNGAYD